MLIPVHNAPGALDRTLASIHAQSTPCHIFVVDDGSQLPVDESNLGDRHRTTLIRLPRRQGVTGALNAGLKAILDGPYDYVARGDAGDVDTAGRLAVQMAYLDQHSETALVGAWTRSCDQAGAHLFVNEYPTSWPAIRRRMRYRTAFSHSACMLRTAALRRFGVYDERYEIGQDLELFRRLVEQAPCANVPEVLVVRTEDPNGVTMSRRARSASIRLMIQIRYFSPFDPHAALGLARSLLMLAVPRTLVFAYKKHRGVVR